MPQTQTLYWKPRKPPQGSPNPPESPKIEPPPPPPVRSVSRLTTAFWAKRGRLGSQNGRNSDASNILRVWKLTFNPHQHSLAATLEEVLMDRPPSEIDPCAYRHEANSSVSALALSPNKSCLVIVGRDIFKILSVDSTPFETQYDVRAGLASKISQGQREIGYSWANLASKDVKWMHGKYDSKIITAAANGHILLYDVNKDGHESSRLHEHHRQVHKLSINPFESGLVLSASQDATVRLWDVRVGEEFSKEAVDKRRSVCFSGNSGPVRDVQWSPSVFHEFAMGTDDGFIQKWDIRKPSAPVLRINAHEKACSAVDWHPNGKLLLSAGADKDVKVWNFTLSDRRMKPLQSMRAPQAITDARWQPMGIRENANDPKLWQNPLIATIFDHEDSRILFWDLRAPYVHRHVLYLDEGPANCIRWQSPGIFWSADERGCLLRTKVSDLPVKTQFIPKGLAICRPDGVLTQIINNVDRLEIDSKSPVENAPSPKTATAVSDTDPFESLDLSTPTRLTSTSMIAEMKIAGVYIDVKNHEFTCNKYKNMEQLPSNVTSKNVQLDLERAMVHNAGVARQANQPNRAQQWMFLSLIGKNALDLRAKANKKLRIEMSKSPFASEDDHTIETDDDEDSESFHPTDFLPSDREDPVNVLPSMQGLLTKMIDDYDHTIGSLQVIVYIFLNLYPWFPLKDHVCSRQKYREYEINYYHDWLKNLQLYVPAAALRKSWVRTFPTAAKKLTAHMGPAKLFCTQCQKVIRGKNTGKCDRCETLTFICAFCHQRRLGQLWVWCQRCGHGEHAGCHQKWFIDENGPGCPTLGCLCKCVIGSEDIEAEERAKAKQEGKGKEAKLGPVVHNSALYTPRSSLAHLKHLK